MLAICKGSARRYDKPNGGYFHDTLCPFDFILADHLVSSCGLLPKASTGHPGFDWKSLTTLIFEMSIRRGHFKQQGLDVKLITIRQSDVIIKATMAGELNFMSVIPTAILASVRGLPIRTIAVNVDNAPYVLVGRPQIKTMSDLKGKKIAVSSLGGMSTLVVREIVARSGLDPDRDVYLFGRGRKRDTQRRHGGRLCRCGADDDPVELPPERQGYTRLAWGPDLCALSNERNLRVARLFRRQPRFGSRCSARNGGWSCGT